MVTTPTHTQREIIRKQNTNQKLAHSALDRKINIKAKYFIK